jgi:DNA repair photolyase
MKVINRFIATECSDDKLFELKKIYDENMKLIKEEKMKKYRQIYKNKYYNREHYYYYYSHKNT